MFKSKRPKTALGVLKATRAILDKPESWGQGAHARTGDGFFVSVRHPAAACFCLHGALIKAAGMKGGEIPSNDSPFKLAIKACNTVLPHRSENPSTNPGSVISFNDDPLRRHAEITTMLDTAIEVAEAV